MTERFKQAPWLPVAQSHNIIIGGAGGIGSVLCFLLARIQPNKITIYDPDTMDNINMSNQLVRVSDIGKNKAELAKELALEFSNYNKIEAIPDYFTEKSDLGLVLFSCFDNMAARKTMFEAFKRATLFFDNPIFIDGRLTAEQFNVYAVTKDRIERYESTLFPDSEAAPLPCGFKGTTHNSFMIASKMVALYTNYCANIATKDNKRELPFSIENDIFTMIEEVIL